ncbi:MAG: RNA polymerase sigma factor [Gemmatimonadaceae bacterium]
MTSPVTEDRGGYVRGRYRNATEAELLAAMRGGTENAIDEFIDRYHRLVLLVARTHHIPPDEREHWAKQLVHDVALWLMEREETPTSLEALVVTCSKRRALARQRDLRARQRIEGEHTVELHGVDVQGRHEHAVSTTTSQGSIQDAAGPACEASPLPVSLERLVSAMEEGLSDGERQLLSWIAQRTSFTTIAEWLGEPRSTVVSRVSRLRVRLLETAYRYTWWLDHAGHAEVLRFFRRTGVFRDEELDTLEQRRATSVDVMRRLERPRVRRVAEREPMSEEEQG